MGTCYFSKLFGSVEGGTVIAKFSDVSYEIHGRFYDILRCIECHYPLAGNMCSVVCKNNLQHERPALDA